PWPRLPILVGQRADGSASFVLGVSVCALVSALAILGAVGASLRSARRGLAGEIVAAAPTPVARVSRRVPFGRAPLLRKELLWFRRDGSAVTQVVLIPLTMAAFQLFNLRGLLSDAQDAWNYLCGAAILFGSYFLFVLGPRSLASEGQALWIAMTWPRGLESLLKAKAQLWALLASAIVTTIFVYAAWRFPASLWKIALVGLGWFVFARSLAEKSVTLATVASPSGEPERPSRGRSMAVSLGMLSFAVGVLSQQWSLAIFGIGCSVMTAAAMWQNFRFRLPYLYDPWSEALPPPPTLMHAMIGIGALVEGASVLSGLALWRFGRDSLPVANALIYAICAIAVALAMARFLAGRGVPTGDVFLWRDARPGRAAPERWLGPDGAGRRRVAAMVAAGVGLGAALGVLAHGYVALLRGFPCFGALIAEAEARIDAIPHARASYFATAVLFAPFAEEYLFRGLLYRALDREWGGWRAVLGSAGFFAIYHPALSWAPVTALGVANAILFKRTGRLAPAIALHIAYNAVVLGWRFG
ncbi:MAG: CPBP family intramembrane glutamic endopeptidase, partial [Roseiarcus sp.]